MPSCSPILSSYFVQFVILSSSFSSKHFPANDSLIRALVLYVHFFLLGALNHVCMVYLLVMIINDYNTTYFCFSWLNSFPGLQTRCVKLGCSRTETSQWKPRQPADQCRNQCSVVNRTTKHLSGQWPVGGIGLLSVTETVQAHPLFSSFSRFR